MRQKKVYRGWWGGGWEEEVGKNINMAPRLQSWCDQAPGGCEGHKERLAQEAGSDLGLKPGSLTHLLGDLESVTCPL